VGSVGTVSRVGIVIGGINSVEAATMCAEEGADALTFIVEYPPFPSLTHWILPREEAVVLMRAVPAYVTRVVVAAGSAREIVALAEYCEPDVMELQGAEPLETVREIARALEGSGVRLTKVLHVNVDDPQRDATDWASEFDRFVEAGADAILFDVVGGPETTDYLGGRKLAQAGAKPERALEAWPVVRDAAASRTRPALLSGGLTIDNVRAALLATGVDMVHVGRALEGEDQRKQRSRVRALIEEVRSTEVEMNQPA
jgi:phosphoribosylanthranilate isomerase